MTKEAVLILGARSDIGLAVAHAFAAQGHPVQLAARDADTLTAAKTDLELRHQIDVSLHRFDVLTTQAHDSFVDGLPHLPEIVVCVVGLMGEQRENETSSDAASLVMRSNYEGPSLILGLLAERFEKRGHGTLVGVSSVAGLRGRASNYVYGSAKAGFSAFLSGLRNRLAKKGVHVLTVLPGFVATKMTEGLDLPPKLTAQPQEVGEAIVKAVQRKRNVIYVKPVWALVMAIICNIPEAIFKKTNL